MILLGSIVLNSIFAPIFLRLLPSIELSKNTFIESFQDIGFHRGVVRPYHEKVDDEVAEIPAKSPTDARGGGGV